MAFWAWCLEFGIKGNLCGGVGEAAVALDYIGMLGAKRRIQCRLEVSRVTHHTSHLTHHTSCLTRHTPHITHHPHHLQPAQYLVLSLNVTVFSCTNVLQHAGAAAGLVPRPIPAKMSQYCTAATPTSRTHTLPLRLRDSSTNESKSCMPVKTKPPLTLAAAALRDDMGARAAQE